MFLRVALRGTRSRNTQTGATALRTFLKFSKNAHTSRYGQHAHPTTTWLARVSIPTLQVPVDVSARWNPVRPSIFDRASKGGRGRLYEGDPRTYSPQLSDLRLLSAPASCSRVSDCNPNLGRLFGIASPSRVRKALCTGHCRVRVAQGIRCMPICRRPQLPPTSIAGCFP